MDVYPSNHINPSFQAENALVFYRNAENGNSGKSEVYCTVNEIENGILKPGQPIDARKLKAIFAEIKDSPQDELSLRWNDDRILASCVGSVVWHVPGAERDIFFSTKNKKLMAVSGKEILWPNLIFKISHNGSLSVWAYKGNSRPTPETRLFRAPFWNIYNSARVCMPHGNKLNPGKIAEAEKLFFCSAFSHPLERTINYKGSHEAFWPKHAKSVKAGFPGDVLISSKLKVKDILK